MRRPSHSYSPLFLDLSGDELSRAGAENAVNQRVEMRFKTDGSPYVASPVAVEPETEAHSAPLEAANSPHYAQAELAPKFKVPMTASDAVYAMSRLARQLKLNPAMMVRIGQWENQRRALMKLGLFRGMAARHSNEMAHRLLREARLGPVQRRQIGLQDGFGLMPQNTMVPRPAFVRRIMADRYAALKAQPALTAAPKFDPMRVNAKRLLPDDERVTPTPSHEIQSVAPSRPMQVRHLALANLAA